MERKQFLKNLATMTAMFSLGGLLPKTSADPGGLLAATPTDHITFGAVHLNCTDLLAATDFWIRVVGMQLRSSTNTSAGFGTARSTLVVVHQTARSAFREGYTGLYHYALHAPDKVEFARMIQRLIDHQYAFSPVDHTMSKSIYLRDPDNVLLEFVLETPERFKRVVAENGLLMEDADGTIRGASDMLDVNAQLLALPDKDTRPLLHPGTKVGHIHFYAADLDRTNQFYKALGFQQFNYLSQYKYADVGAGGPYQHRVAMNNWHGMNRPPAPEDHAGLRHYHIVFDSSTRLQEALGKIEHYEKRDDGYWLSDPSGNRLCLQSQ